MSYTNALGYAVIFGLIAVVGYLAIDIWRSHFRDHPAVVRFRNRVGRHLINLGVGCMRGEAKQVFTQVLQIYAMQMEMKMAVKRGDIDPGLKVPRRTTDEQKAKDHK